VVGRRLRVACVGDSITLGLFSARSYPKQLQDLLGPSYIVRSFAASDATVLRKTARPYQKSQEYLGALLFAPDYAVLQFGAHDSKASNWQEHGTDFALDYTRLIEAFHALPSKPKVFIMTPLPIYHKKPYGMDPKVVNDVIRKQILNITRSNVLQAPIDAFSMFLEHCPLSDSHCERMKWDGVHPNAQGDEDIAKLVFTALQHPADLPEQTETSNSGAAGAGLRQPEVEAKKERVSSSGATETQVPSGDLSRRSNGSKHAGSGNLRRRSNGTKHGGSSNPWPGVEQGPCGKLDCGANTTDSVVPYTKPGESHTVASFEVTSNARATLASMPTWLLVLSFFLSLGILFLGLCCKVRRHARQCPDIARHIGTGKHYTPVTPVTPI